MQYKDKTSFTSDPFELKYQAVHDVYLTVTGAGPVYLEQQEEDGVWRYFPETTFSGTTAQVVRLKRGQCRVRVAAATATTVEIRL